VSPPGARRLTALAGVLLLACGGGGGGAGMTVASGGGGDMTATATGEVNSGVLSVPVSVARTTALPFVLDTGSVLTRLDPSRLPSLMLQPGLEQVSTLDVGTLHLDGVQVVAATLCGVMMMCRGSEPAGLLGGETLLDMRVSIDYRAATVTFGNLVPPANVGPPVTTAFSLEGGGQGAIDDHTTLTLPATRIVLPVTVEGTEMTMVLDTGSSTMILRPDVYDSIVADGRPQSSIDVATVLGVQTTPLTILQYVSVGGEIQGEVEAVRAPLDVGSLETEVGHRVDGLLGGAYLMGYVTTIDYPERALTLRPYLETTAR
jgi:hypothetical protein